MEEEILLTITVILTMVMLKMGYNMVMELINGLMEESIKGIGVMEKLKDMER